MRHPASKRNNLNKIKTSIMTIIIEVSFYVGAEDFFDYFKNVVYIKIAF